ncbi:NUDIX domain-containing protein [Candidatus Kaiserbacteria bacterium]|nr:NUDIX domain-containing protein [Candidatus Kaiserbacteria bacterium]
MAHIHERIDFTASVYVVFENKVLLHKHKKYNIWLPPGGHIELDEDPVQAAKREVKEETGLDVKLVGESEKRWADKSIELLPPRFVNRHYTEAGKNHEHVDFIYLGTSESDALTPEDEDGEMRWFSKEDMGVNPEIKDNIRFYAPTALHELAT